MIVARSKIDLVASMKLFARVTELRSFARAAEEIGVNPSFVSRSVSSLEKHLSARLFNRTTRKVSLTESGSIFLRHAKRILGDIEEAENCFGNLNSKPQGVLKISAPVAFGEIYVVPLLLKFLGKWPELSIDLITTDGLPDLVEHQIDVAIQIGDLRDSRFIAKKLTANPQAMVASTAYLSKRSRPKSLEELSSHQCLLENAVNQRAFWEIRTGQQKHRVEVTGRFSSTSPSTLRQACLKGLGIAFLPHWLVRGDLASGKLVSLLEDICPGADNSRGAIYAVTHSHSFAPSKVKHFLNFISDELKSFGAREDRDD